MLNNFILYLKSASNIKQSIYEISNKANYEILYYEILYY